MTIKTYRAKTIADALAQVKKDLGRDAVILHTRTFKAGGLLGFGAHSVTEITASSSLTIGADLGLSPRSSRERKPIESLPARSLVTTVPGIPEPPVQVVAPPPSSAPLPLPSRPVEVAVGPQPTSMRSELDAIKRMVGQVLQNSRGVRHHGVSDELFDCYLKLIQSEVASDIADEIIGSVRDELSADELRDSEVVRQAVLRRLSAYVAVADGSPKLERSADGRPLTIALVGPTGVGKTTTVAKLAATYKLRRGQRVGLITSDTYRIAAVDQLRTYANIIGLPLKVAMTPAEMTQACESLADCDVILIDTAGRSPRDDERLEELRRFISAARPHETHLVLASNANEAAMRTAAERFASLQPRHIIFTKLDEAVNFGILVNVARTLEATLSYVTTGQEVPDQIESGNPDRLARLVLDGATKSSSISATRGMGCVQ